MATIDEMMADLEAADSAGDAELATHIAGLIRAEEEKSKPHRERVGAGEAGIRGALQGASFGWADEIASTVDAFLPAALRNETSAEAVAPNLSDVVAGTAGDTFAERRARALKWYRDRNARAAADNPVTYTGSQLAGGIGTAMVPAGVAAKGGTVLARALQGAKVGAGVGGVAGAGASEAEGAGGVLRDALGGAMFGGAIGGALPLAGAAIKAPFRTGGATPAARQLMSEGVPLTTGQALGPKSFISQLEAVASRNPAGMEAERQAAREAWMLQAFNKGRAPGTAPLAAKNVQGAYDEALKGFEKAYAAFDDIPIKDDLLEGLGKVARAPRKGIDERTAKGAASEIENALTILGKAETPPAPAASGLLDATGRPIPAPAAPAAAPRNVKFQDLQAVRSQIRKYKRDAVKSEDLGRLRMLQRAEEVVTDAMESSIPEDAAQALRNVDQQYARLMVAGEAAPGGQSTFTPLQYLRKASEAVGSRNFKRGEGGDLQKFGEAAQETFVDAPLTGFRGSVLGAIPGGHYLAGPLTRALNAERVKRALTSPPRPRQSSLRAPAVTAEQSALLDMLGLRAAGAAAEEGDTE